jgi:5'-nucleotidase/UDP-sugar diphosphatase
VTLARQVNGIDVIVGGHTQKPLFEPDVQNGTVIVQAYEWGKYVGKVDLEVSEGKVTLKSYKLIPVNLKESTTKIKNDEKIEALLKPFKDRGDKSLLIKVGTADKEFIGKRDIVRSQETNLGNLISRAYQAKFKADLAVSNSGGIRDSIYPGDVTIETVLMVLPFAGEVVTAELNGEELKKYLEFVAVNMTPGSGSFPQMSGVEIKINKASGKATSVKVQGKEVNATQKYTVALPEFIASGGDKYPVLNYRKYGYVDADLLKEYIQKIKTLKASAFAPTGYLTFE